MANNATTAWRWDGRTSTAWDAANWLDLNGDPVDDWPAGNLPTHVVVFDGGDLAGVNKCDTGPDQGEEQLVLASVTSRNGYDADASAGEFITWGRMDVSVVQISDSSGCKGGYLGIVTVDGDGSEWDCNDDWFEYHVGELIVNGDDFLYTETGWSATMQCGTARFNGAGAVIEGGEWQALHVLRDLLFNDANFAGNSAGFVKAYVYGALTMDETWGSFGPWGGGQMAGSVKLMRREATFTPRWNALMMDDDYAVCDLAMLGGVRPLE